jgi:Pretoxin HINT domain
VPAAAPILRLTCLEGDQCSVYFEPSGTCDGGECGGGVPNQYSGSQDQTARAQNTGGSAPAAAGESGSSCSPYCGRESGSGASSTIQLTPHVSVDASLPNAAAIAASFAKSSAGFDLSSISNPGLEATAESRELFDWCKVSSSSICSDTLLQEFSQVLFSFEGGPSQVGLGNLVIACGGGQSFTPDTQVVLADGTTKPLDKVTIGDKVKATDPSTGKTTPETVTTVWVNHDSDLMDLTVVSNGKLTTIHTTQDHLFWDDTRRQWVEVRDLAQGDRLKTDDQTTVTVDTQTKVPTSADMWDLTVATTHDFYVVTTPLTAVLVHNDSCPNPNGRNGGLAHQAKVAQLQAEVEERGSTVRAEFKIRTPNGFKTSRFMDVAEIGKDGAPVRFYQVGRQTSSGIPVMRESQAIWDVVTSEDMNAGVPITFVPYNLTEDEGGR